MADTLIKRDRRTGMAPTVSTGAAAGTTSPETAGLRTGTTTTRATATRITERAAVLGFDLTPK